MNQPISTVMLFALTISVIATAAESLAEKYVVVHRVRDLDAVGKFH